MSVDRQAAAGRVDAASVDLDALLVALVLVPHSYPRNRFFQLFRDREAFRVRRRAALLRGVITELVTDAEEIRVQRRADGRVALSYRLTEPGVSRTTIMDAREVALVKHAVSRAKPAVELPVDPASSAELQALLSRLLPLSH